MQYSIARNKYSRAVFICFTLILILTALLSLSFLQVCVWSRVNKVLFIFGTESVVFSKIFKWCRLGGGGTLRRLCCVATFSNSYFSDKIYENGVRHFINFHFSLFNSKKRSKNPSLDDSL